MRSLTFEIKSGVVGLQGKVISSRNTAGAGNRCLEAAGGRTGLVWKEPRCPYVKSALLAAGAQLCHTTLPMMFKKRLQRTS